MAMVVIGTVFVDIKGFAGTDLDEGRAEHIEAGIDGDFGVSDNIFGIDLCRPRARGSARDKGEKQLFFHGKIRNVRCYGEEFSRVANPNDYTV